MEIVINTTFPLLNNGHFEVIQMKTYIILLPITTIPFILVIFICPDEAKTGERK